MRIVRNGAAAVCLCLATGLSRPVGAHEGEQPEDYETVVSSRRPYTAASSSTVRNEDFATRPLGDPSDILEVTPGLFTVQHAGGGKANQYFLRGFDLDHGTDIALSVDGLPVNMVSHAHGQGYADLHFVIPETVERIEVTKGPYAAEQGDFATAGAANLVTRDSFEQSQAAFTTGSFDTFRGLLIAAPKAGPILDEKLQSYVAGEIYGSNGPFIRPERLRRFNLLARAAYNPTADTQIVAQGQANASGWRASGQIPLRAVESGALDRFDSIDPTEGGSSQRHSASLSLHHHSPGGGDFKLMAYAIRYRLDLYSNFTFFRDDPVNGDQIEQTDSRVVIGMEGRYSRSDLWRRIRFHTIFGARLRNDDIDNGLFHDVRRERLRDRVDAHVSEGSLGLFAEEDTQWTDWLRSVIGLRTDYFGFQVADHLEDLPTLGNRTSGTAQTVRFSPKASLVVNPVAPVDLYFNFGRGFHSNDARGVVRAVEPVTPLAIATGYELGARTRLFGKLDVAAALWALELSSEIVWVGDEGTTEARPSTRRRGVEIEVRYRISSWLRLDADLTWARARFTREVGGGLRIPLAPSLTWAGGIQADHPSGVFGSLRLQGLGRRPATEDGSLTAQGFALADLEAGYQDRRFRVSLAVRNLLNSSWRQAQFANESRLQGELQPVADIHFTPGYPRTLLGSVGVFF